MPRKKKITAPEGASAPPSDAVTVTYLGAEPVCFNSHSFSPGEPVPDLPADIIAALRSKPMFQVNDGHAQ